MFAFVVASLLLVARVSGQAAPDVCWKDTWDRGVGTIPDSCDASEVRGVWPGAPGSCGEGLPSINRHLPTRPPRVWLRPVPPIARVSSVKM